jgi:hypothetical protein
VATLLLASTAAALFKLRTRTQLLPHRQLKRNNFHQAVVNSHFFAEKYEIFGFATVFCVHFKLFCLKDRAGNKRSCRRYVIIPSYQAGMVVSVLHGGGGDGLRR